MANVFSKIFGTKQDREIRRMLPMVEEVNEIILALHDYGESPRITDLLGIDKDEIIGQSREFEKKWAELVRGIADDDPERAQKLRKAEEEAAEWFIFSADGSPPVYDWRAVYWGIEYSMRAKDKWAGAGDDWILVHLEERVGKPIYKELRAELGKIDKNAFDAWLSAKKELSERVRPALVARTRGWQRVLAERAKEIAEEVKKTDEDARKDLWKKRTNEALEPIKIEAFALVRETCYLRLGDSWDVRGFSTTWDMFPFNVQIIGAVVLHEGKITEMRTGEGKTLAATMPLYLNALMGRGAHLVTHNDFLASRDKEWMGPIYEYLGLTVGVIHTGMNPHERRPEYACDITYGTNNEFGFDYLRDNMVHSLDRKAQRGHAYAIVDEVDSLLIDEARTPLIISGPTEYVDRGYQRYKSGVERLFRTQQRLSNERAAEAERLIKEEKEMDAAKLLLMVKRSTPKHKRLLRFQKEGSIKRLIDDVELMHMREKKLHELDAENYFTYDEHMRAVELNDKGRELLNPRDPDAFTLPDLSTGLDAIDKRKDLPAKQKLKKKEELYQEYASKSEMLNNHHALLKAYVLFNKDEDYIVDGGKVVIVDSFTGRPQPGRRYSDGLHEALEAKEGVRVQEETQTVASITHQNYFRMYEKLAGMTGTAMTDANEFVQVYKMDDPIAIPTNKPVRRIDYTDIVYATRNEKYQAVIEEIEYWHETGRPILVGTTSVDVSEILSRLLKRKGINHNVLNAKQHQREAEIVREAGKKHKVTIATNMAGRGTDIKLTPEVLDIETKCRIEKAQTEQEIEKFKSSKDCQKDFPTGLLIIGTERHESRRIDNQLRGRSGRQGDPGASRFFLSLEDDLLRIFGADRMQKAIEGFSKNEMEPISTPLVTRAIENAQKRVEQNNFEMRKRLLEYDDVMNRQREEIYATRDEILAGEDLDGLCRFIYGEVIDLIISERLTGSMEEWDWEGLQADFITYFMVGFEIPSAEERAKLKLDGLSDKLLIIADKAFSARKELMAEKFDDFQKLVLLMTIDKRWREHLREMDELKKGIGLRQYGQKDPVIEYKREAFGKYEEMVRTFQKEVTKLLFRAQLKQAPVRRQAPVHAHKDDASGIPAGQAEQPTGAPGVNPQ
ncbi:preprotein translocase subunit SecA, partial [candidate division WOR-3 bacterium]|nr:preprotein translocase subunit SecA [candidate division WOR-3 bacterium]MBD3364459.1 preprotein translocase subunit SecA [candidate division WOR-3 bacterium]